MDLPTEIWWRPIQKTETTMFKSPVDTVLAECHVSRDDLRRWRESKWISFDVDSEIELDEPEYCEICFVRNLARSGLADAQIAELLDKLPKPYRYDPCRVAYHFGFGWVQPIKIVEKDPFDVVADTLVDWFDHLAADCEIDSLKAIRDQIDERIDAIETEEE